VIADFEMTFKGQRDFEALHLAEEWCRANGYSYGRLERGAPIGLLRGDFDISKWRGMTAAEREALHGTMSTSDLSYRHGPVVIRIKAMA
jgi:hypothetical protein